MVIANAGKFIVFIGLGLVVLGAAIWLFGRLFPNFRGLPGDIRYESDNVRIYIPIVTCIVLSIIITALLWLWRMIAR